MSASPSIPGLYYSFVRPPTDPSPLRTDVAGFFGRTKRGPAGKAVRVEGWREFVNVFGDLIPGAMTPYVVRGYYDNWATTAHVVRVLGTGSQAAAGTWTPGTLDHGKPDHNWPGDSGLRALSFNLTATSPGEWANGLSFVVRYLAHGSSGKPELEIEITPPDEPVETLTGIHPEKLAKEVNAKSLYVRLEHAPLPAGLTTAELRPPKARPGPRYHEYDPVVLSGGTAPPPSRTDYLAAADALGDEVEVSLVVCPDLYDSTLSFPNDQWDIINVLLTQASALHDRLVILDVPPHKADPVCALGWLTDLRKTFPDELLLRNVAVYHPRLLVPDPLGDTTSPLLSVVNSGLVAGVISRLDKQLGPYATPANAPIYEAVDLASRLDGDDQTALYQGGINLLKCSPGKGLLVWGGRVLGPCVRNPTSVPDCRGGFVAHRRLIHTLVRAIRRVAEPLVFDTNGPQLWLAFVRSITSVLLEAYRAGALKGSRPEEAFHVKCDAETNPPENIDNGLCICLVQVAPAVPMEFITLRVAVSADGKLEVFES
jgi:hypothetical protein